MQQLIRMVGLIATCFIAWPGISQTALSVSSLCALQEQVTRGEHRTVRVEGVYLAGLEGEYIVAAGCSERSTRIEFALKTKHNWAKLGSMVNEPYKGKSISGQGEPVMVIFKGEFYGPPMPDPNLPEAIRKIYHPGWDSNSKTKLIVSSIESVKAVPRHHPCAPPQSDPTQWPCFQHPSPPYKDKTK